MNIYIKHFKNSNRISHYLRASQLITGRWAIETKIFNQNDWYININLPDFDTEEIADKWLQENYEIYKEVI